MINVLPGQANLIALTVLGKANNAPIVTGTVSLYLQAQTGTNAGKWFKGADGTWSAAEAVAGAAAHVLAGQWTASLPAATWTAGVAYIAYMRESGELQVPASTDVLCQAAGGACTISQIKVRLGITDTSADAVLAGVIAGVSAQFEAHCSRRLFRPAAAVTEYHNGGWDGQQSVVYLDYYPAVVITTVKEGLLHDYDDALTANDDYIFDDRRGRLIAASGCWLAGDDAVQVVYVGGYTDPSTTPLPTGEVYVPAEIQEAGIQQSCFNYQRRLELGLSGVSAGGNVSAYAQDELLPGVKAMLAPYRRVLL